MKVALLCKYFLQGLHTAVGSVEAADASEIVRSRCKTGCRLLLELLFLE